MAVWHGPRILFVTLLALSIGTKLVLGAAEYRGDGEQGVARRTVLAFLHRQGFRTGEPEEDTQLWGVPAVRTECRLRVAIVSPQGWHREVIHRTAPPGSHVFFVVDGTIYQDQPEWRTRVRYYWQRMNGLIGRQLPPALILGVIASPGCEWLDGTWSTLRAAADTRP